MEDDRPEEHPAETSLLGCLIPTFWMLIGNGILALSALAIAAGETLFGVADVFYWATVGCLLAARYADIRYFAGKTSEGKSATMAHYRRYSIILCVVSGVVWIVVHLIPRLEF
jgi:uncharacterized membrane protein